MICRRRPTSSASRRAASSWDPARRGFYGFGNWVLTLIGAQGVAFTKGGIRAEEADEIVGMDMPEMGVYAYPQFLAAEEEAIDAGLVTHQGEPVHRLMIRSSAMVGTNTIAWM